MIRRMENICRHCQLPDPLGILAEQEARDIVQVAQIQADSALALDMERHRHDERMAGVYAEQSVAAIEVDAPITETEAAVEQVEAISDAIEGAAVAEAEAEIEVAEIEAETAIHELDDEVPAPARESESEEEKPKSIAGRLLG